MPNLRRASLAAALALLAPGLALASTDENTATTEFVVLGDIPYGPDQARTLTNQIGKRIRKENYPFVVHYGDIRAGYESCDGSIPPNRDYKPTTRHQRDLIYGLLPGAVFYTPGDNDWTDCDRKGLGDALKSLKEVRSVFFGASEDLPSVSTWKVKRQERYPENARWEHNKLMFAALHIVGSDNGRYEIIPSNKANVTATLDEVDARDNANREWLDQTFDQAKAESSEALVLFMQADPGEIEYPDQRSRACDESVRTECNPYLAFLEQLTARAGAFDKPVLLVHGSTNKFCLDKGFGGWKARKLWRLNGPGDYVTIDAAVVSFAPNSQIPFAVRGLMSKIAPPDCQGR